ncbi:MAG TPA: hypothetical protein VJS44_18545 [Pyrinomonadaceae bacterium]|nr:hypothetical protein [Pyrinomonadaceae bacterium]
MGNFYTNVTLLGPDQDSIAEYVAEQNRNAYVSPTVNNFTVVYDEQCESQDTDILEELASELSKRFSCPALAVLNHDDDILWYKLFEAGQLTDEYDSCPDYFEAEAELSMPKGGDAGKLCSVFKSEQNVTEVERILRAPNPDAYTFAYERHEDLARALGIPTFSVGCGYNYILQDELPEGLEFESLKQTGEPGTNID